MAGSDFFCFCSLKETGIFINIASFEHKMELKDAIKERRSIRKYQNTPVSNDLITQVIDAARLAPSGNNTQPWRFYIVKEGEERKNLQEQEVIRDKWVYQAPVIIVCCTDPQAYVKHIEGWDDPNEIRAIRDLAIASANITLQATDLGLGTCYCGWIKDKEIKEILQIPEHFVIPYVITLGYPDQDPPARPRKDITEIVLNPKALD